MHPEWDLSIYHGSISRKYLFTACARNAYTAVSSSSSSTTERTSKAGRIPFDIIYPWTIASSKCPAMTNDQVGFIDLRARERESKIFINRQRFLLDASSWFSQYVRQWFILTTSPSFQTGRSEWWYPSQSTAGWRRRRTTTRSITPTMLSQLDQSHIHSNSHCSRTTTQRGQI